MPTPASTRLKTLVLALLILIGLTGCDEEWWIDTQRQVADCHHAVDALWPASSRAWAHRIVDAESGGDPAAQNRRSSAAGCFQLVRVHAWRFDATGSSWSFRYDGRANTLAALHLYNEQGTGPWR